MTRMAYVRHRSLHRARDHDPRAPCCVCLRLGPRIERLLSDELSPPLPYDRAERLHCDHTGCTYIPNDGCLVVPIQVRSAPGHAHALRVHVPRCEQYARDVRVRVCDSPRADDSCVWRDAARQELFRWLLSSKPFESYYINLPAPGTA
jgi:hypothetical protein